MCVCDCPLVWVVSIPITPSLPHRCDSHAVAYTSPCTHGRKFITRGKWCEAIPALGVLDGDRLVLAVEVSHPCIPFRCLHPIPAAMCGCNRIVAACHPHVCVHITHIPRQDANRLYQPAQRKAWGGIGKHLIQSIMNQLSVDTKLFTALPGGRSWLFDPFGGPATEGGGVDRGAVPRVATRRRMSH